MRKKLILAPALAALSFSGLASAEQYEPRPYVGINGTLATIEVDTTDNDSEDFDVGMASAKAGAMVTPYFGVETRLGFGVGDDEFRVGNERVKVELDNLVGGYLVLGAPLGPVFPYIIGGYTRVELSADYDGTFGSVSGSDTDHDTSYGAGVNFRVTDNVAINGEYMRYYDEEGVELTGVSAGLTLLF